MAGTLRPRRAPRTGSRRYHHGNLRRALIQEAVRVVQADGVEALTLRAVGQAIGVSRTALYRHFADKVSLLAAVACEGFRTLRTALLAAQEHVREDPAAIGVAYVQFAVAHPSHYRIMFGAGFVDRCARDPALTEEAAGAFQVLVDAVVSQQRAGRVREDDPVQLARFIWALVHGIARLAIDGQLRGSDADAERLTRYSLGRMRTGIAVRSQ